MESVRITVRAKPGSSRTNVGGSYGDDRQLIIAVTAPAVDGRANDAVVTALAKALGVPRRDITVASGATSRTKVMAVATDDAALLREHVARLLDPG